MNGSKIINVCGRLLLGSVLLLSAAGVVWAKGPANVTNTIHNLSTSAPFIPESGAVLYSSSNVTEVCVFCHTPHGGLTEGPLWNRNLPSASGFTHYSSTSLSDDMKAYAVNRNVGDESRLCLSCHDGVLTLDHLINPPNEINGAPVDVNGVVDPVIYDVPSTKADAVIGYDLSDDHPISFSYDNIIDQTLYTSGGRVGELHTVPEALAAGVRFFAPGNRIECSSCHDPHVDYMAGTGNPAYDPFLITPNAGSNLCRACHNK